MTNYICTDCGSKVGGIDYKLMNQNTMLDKIKDETKPGYLLTTAHDAKNAPTGER